MLFLGPAIYDFSQIMTSLKSRQFSVYDIFKLWQPANHNSSKALTAFKSWQSNHDRSQNMTSSNNDSPQIMNAFKSWQPQTMTAFKTWQPSNLHKPQTIRALTIMTTVKWKQSNGLKSWLPSNHDSPQARTASNHDNLTTILYIFAPLSNSQRGIQNFQVVWFFSSFLFLISFVWTA